MSFISAMSFFTHFRPYDLLGENRNVGFAAACMAALEVYINFSYGNVVEKVL